MGWALTSGFLGAKRKYPITKDTPRGRRNPVTEAKSEGAAARTVDVQTVRSTAEQFLDGAGKKDAGGADACDIGISEVELAQRIANNARAAKEPERAVELAKQALAVSEDCADAYVVLATHDSVFPGEIAERYRQAVAAGERALGAKVFEEQAGRFWSVPQTRPYMRALAGLAMSLWRLREREAAISHYQEMLRLNPVDNQGMRYVLMACLLATRRIDEAEALYARYKNDRMAAWAYSRVWLDFYDSGGTEQARKSLKRAVKVNPLVPAYLTGKKKLPEVLPRYYGIGNENEAIVYAKDHGAVWKSHAQAIKWLIARTASRRHRAVR